MFGAFLRGRLLALAAAFVVSTSLMGCAGGANGPTLQSMKTTAPLKGMARIVVFRASEYGGILDFGWPIMLDGKPVGDIKTGSFAYADRPAGRHQLSVDMGSQFPGTPVVRHTFTTAPGRTYYFQARVNDRGQALTAVASVAGLVGYAVATAATSDDSRGPVDFVPIDSASGQLAELRMIQPGS